MRHYFTPQGKTMKQTLKLLSVLSLLTLSTQAYDANKAASLNTFYSHMTHKACANSKLFIKGVDVMKMLQQKKPLLLLDVRTDAEAAIVGLTGDNALHISLDRLFHKESLDKLPTDRPVIVVCHSGIRATMAAMGLKQLGFKNIQVLKGGIVALAKADTPKNAPLK